MKRDGKRRNLCSERQRVEREGNKTTKCAATLSRKPVLENISRIRPDTVLAWRYMSCRLFLHIRISLFRRGSRLPANPEWISRVLAECALKIHWCSRGMG